jgi:hypothetical protein
MRSKVSAIEEKMGSWILDMNGGWTERMAC